MSEKLKCPHCASTDRFTICAAVWVAVAGSDYLDVLDESGDREYGSESACRCSACSHQAAMGEFYDTSADIETDTFTLPSHWAGYLINGDLDELDDGEQAVIDQFIADEALAGGVVSVGEDADFHPMHNATQYGVKPCDCHEFTWSWPMNDRAGML